MPGPFRAGRYFKEINMASKLPFFTDGMTVNQILELGDDILSKLNKRDLSHALRTVALAANKRIKRLLQYVKKRKEKGKYVEKKNGPGLDLSALNNLQGNKFSVGKKNRNQIYQELARARTFMGSKTSTVKGAIEARKNKDRAMLGQTREDLTKGMTPQEKKEEIENIKDLESDIYNTYDTYKDKYGMSGNYEVEEGKAILQDIAQYMRQGYTEEEAMEMANKAAMARYETNRYVEDKEGTFEDFWSSINGDPNPEDEW